MTREQAIAALRLMMVSVQKVRSNLREGMGDDQTAESLNADLNPWLFGPKNILPKLVEAIRRYEAGEPIPGMEFYNFMWIGHKVGFVDMTAHVYGPPGLPELDMNWVSQTW